MLAHGQAGGGEQYGEQAQAMPSLRLFTSPAWVAADSAGSGKLVWRRPVGVTSPLSSAVVRARWRPPRARRGRGSAHSQGRQPEAECGERDAELGTARGGARRGGEVAGGQGGGGDGEVAGGFVSPMARPRLAGPTRSIFMMTVVDQVSPWLIPSKTLAAITQPQFGAQISSSGRVARSAIRRPEPVCGRSGPTRCRRRRWSPP